LDQQTWNETDRLNALREYDILDTPFEQNFDEIVQLASQICETPVSLVTLIDADQQWFKAAVGTEIRQMPLNMAFCTKAIKQTNLFTIEDASKDPDFQNNPLVASNPNVRFYAGVPLATPYGFPLGTLCVLDYKPRKLSPLQENTLRILAHQVMAQFELHRTVAELKRQIETLKTV
jgi:GAF domain-containing protein